MARPALPRPGHKGRTGSSIGRNAGRDRSGGKAGRMDAVRTDLTELEAIRRLKYKYLRCVDLKLWDEIADVFTPDATADYGTPSAGRPLNLNGRDEIVGFLRESLGNGIITLHAAGQPEIDIDPDTGTATGSWRFTDTVIATEFRVVISGAAFYEDRYELGHDGRWRISHTGYQRLYEASMSLDDWPSWQLTANRWAG